ncbi:DUF4811 domain-containing protein [Lentilactobacillus kisonensis]|uniref:DUF4811 domain-containing protein n=2 Tax=Lentilactobacillus kisonensis TaxID=481722 RepID=A0A0R1NSU5_9LACO|nr:DUF4811 domain-containing protein [Lentilactobacillus kisonensis]KRL23151.1 hypothetical protein FC98_GL001191 [Lentilactobacillus kisonensis DSM 19906 = JCM 15041]
MILVTLTISIVLSFIFFIYIENKTWSNVLTGIAIICAVLSTFYIVKNDHDHYGMKQVTETTAQPIYSVGKSKQMQMVLYQPIGSANKKQVYIYQKSADTKKKSHTRAKDDTSNKVVRINGESKMITKTTRWKYKNKTAKLWFGIADEGNKLVKQHNTLYINKDWLVLSTTQAKALQKKMADKAYQAKLKTAGKAFVEKQVMAAMQKNPTMSAADRGKLVKQAIAEFQAQAVKKLIASLK